MLFSTPHSVIYHTLCEPQIPFPLVEKVAADGSKHFHLQNINRHLMTEKVY
jgi:hypothetical protein